MSRGRNITWKRDFCTSADLLDSRFLFTQASPSQLSGDGHPVVRGLSINAHLVQQRPFTIREQPRSREPYGKGSVKHHAGCNRVQATRTILVGRAFNDRSDLRRAYSAATNVAQLPDIDRTALSARNSL